MTDKDISNGHSKNTDELQYLNLLNEILLKGNLIIICFKN